MWTDRFEDLLVEETVENLTEAPRSPRQTQGKQKKETLEAAHSKPNWIKAIETGKILLIDQAPAVIFVK